jgi:cyclic dehypoxanthinyl futalosine synthase
MSASAAATVATPQTPAAGVCTGPVRAGRLSEADALAMYDELSLHDLGRLAFQRVLALHPEPYRTYVVDRNINYSNVCTAKCIFCNFKADPGDADAYTLTFEQIGRKIEELLDIGGTQILMQGGLVPGPSAGPDIPARDTLPFEWYLDLLRFIREHYPTIHIHAFSPPEIWAFHKIFGMPLREVLLRLQEAGLATIPGGGGEILADRVRRRIGQGKTLSGEWLEVMRQAHQLGMKTSCTMMFGHIETIEERIEHLRVLRDLQDETGGFTAFIHWPFQPEGTPLGKWPRLPLDAGAQRPRPDGQRLLLADAHEYLVMLAIARLYLDTIPNIQSSWVTMGPKIGQLGLFFGANDMGSVMMEENVVSQAGATFRLSERELCRLITDAGWIPQQRDQYYRPVDTTAQRRARASAEAPAGAPATIPLTISAHASSTAPAAAQQ